MTANRTNTDHFSLARAGSDLARVDAHVIQPREYDELPDLSDRDITQGVTEVAGAPLRGRPALGGRAKQAVSLRIDPETLGRFKAEGPGWQTRMSRLLDVNEFVLLLISQHLELIDSMEAMLSSMRNGELRTVFEPIETTIARVESNIRRVTETTRTLRDQLVVE